MKKTLLFLLFIFCVCFAYWNRYQPVSLDLIAPSIKQAEIKGEVQNPGIYSIKWDGTLQDLINEAGGLTNDADVTNLTLLQRVEADSTMFIPSKEETQQLISINSASKEELCRLPKIGPALADRIIAYRQQKPFSTIEEIMNVKGIGQKMFDGIKDQISL